MLRFALLVILFFQFVLHTVAQPSGCSFLCNTDFDDNQIVSAGSFTIINEASVSCWRTTAADNNIEVWGNGFNGVPSYSGNQFVELNANMVSTLYQDFTPLPGSTALISFAHRGRAGIDVLSVEIGPSGTGPFTTLGTFSADNTAWVYDTVSYTFPSTASGTYSLRFNSVSAAGGPTVGNFLDAISIELPRPILNFTVTEPSCTDSTAGSITLNVSGATAPYSYSWSTGNSTTNSLTGLGQGSYSVVVSDLYGCTSSTSFFLMGVPVLSMTVTQQEPSCFGFTNGSINISINSGTPPYSVLWNQPGVTGLSPSGLASG
ncbi:MAG: hypothetical protein RL213_2210, partial [Bacteroidota bacterium]